MDSREGAWILVVEDDECTASLLMTLLAERGWRTEQAQDGAEALELVVAARRAPALVLLDLMLPKMDGETLGHGLGSVHGSPVPVILLSACSKEKLEATARRIGAVSWLAKPFNIDDLVRSVEASMPLPAAPRHDRTEPVVTEESMDRLPVHHEPVVAERVSSGTQGASAR